MGKLINKMKLFHLILLILSGVLIISALPFKTQYANIIVNVSTTIDKATADDTNPTLGHNQKNLFDFFTYYDKDDFQDNNGVKFENDFNVYKEKVYNFENDLNSLNTLILWFGIVTIVGVALLYLFSNNSRRIYYKSNIIMSSIFTLTVVVFGIIVLVKSFSLMGTFSSDSNLYNYVAVFQNQDISTEAFQKACIISGNTYVAGSLDFVKENFSCTVATFIGYDVLFVVSIAYVIFVFILSMSKYKATSERRNELTKVVTAND
jgi:hypothetical protein